MNLVPEMFLSKWHLITLGMIIVAWIALGIGGYDRKTVLRSGLGATVLLYVITTAAIAPFVQYKDAVEKRMIAELDRQYAARQESGQELSGSDQLAAAAAAFREDTSYIMYIYAGNYSESEPFTGSLIMRIYDDSGKLLQEETYEKLTLKPGEKKKLDSLYSSKSGGKYEYQFTSLSSEGS
ncbi:hypothetical protein [Paenibacillus pinistramenti]|uniref:hypothetical protein n=1 Tax=Paenibacillus pinistramenti TaxID=1768003 RepID=UPI00110998A0|nr:hypothetical protein [Paenibacillus pinistramenti]